MCRQNGGSTWPLFHQPRASTAMVETECTQQEICRPVLSSFRVQNHTNGDKCPIFSPSEMDARDFGSLFCFFFFWFCVDNSKSQAGGVLSSWRGNSIIRLHRSNRNGRSRKGWLLWGRDGGGLNRKIAPFFTALCQVADRPVVCFAPNNQN